MSKSSQIVFVTGASGFLGFWLVYQLLEAGYLVRGSARGKKLEGLKRAFAGNDRFEAVEVADVITSDLTDAFEGVHALIHSAAPLVGRADTEAALKLAVEGTRNVFEAAEKAGIKKIVVTGSLATYPNTFVPPPWTHGWGPRDFNPITLEEAKQQGHPGFVYIAEKTITEKTALEFGRKFTDTDVIIICPPFLYGPFAPGFEHVATDVNSMSTNEYMYGLVVPTHTEYPPATSAMDIRDTVRIHIAAIESDVSRSLPVDEKRFIVNVFGRFSFQDAIQLLLNKRPALKTRLADPTKAPAAPPAEYYAETLGLERIEEVFGIPVSSYITWQQTVLESVDSALALEKLWQTSAL
ncbi:NAD(P)-binding protein [Fistulina hepatica ATCC 64428]|uniref:NAD(P)-binding protein n=1 Tax=Fistulina hepatica ATCC 64428 TaxID=1128425 RepID=A0A0D7AN13_9AGAR|nr:NAD(P)-binding protein [Fistulina hepatica ATCC 64428]